MEEDINVNDLVASSCALMQVCLEEMHIAWTKTGDSKRFVELAEHVDRMASDLVLILHECDIVKRG